MEEVQATARLAMMLAAAAAADSAAGSLSATVAPATVPSPPLTMPCPAALPALQPSAVPVTAAPLPPGVGMQGPNSQLGLLRSLQEIRQSPLDRPTCQSSIGSVSPLPLSAPALLQPKSTASPHIVPGSLCLGQATSPASGPADAASINPVGRVLGMCSSNAAASQLDAGSISQEPLAQVVPPIMQLRYRVASATQVPTGESIAASSPAPPSQLSEAERFAAGPPVQSMRATIDMCNAAICSLGHQQIGGSSKQPPVPALSTEGSQQPAAAAAAAADQPVTQSGISGPCHCSTATATNLQVSVDQGKSCSIAPCIPTDPDSMTGLQRQNGLHSGVVPNIE